MQVELRGHSNPTYCNQIHLHFLHLEAMGMLKHLSHALSCSQKPHCETFTTFILHIFDALIFNVSVRRVLLVRCPMAILQHASIAGQGGIGAQETQHVKTVQQVRTGWPRHRENRENREFGSYFFQTGKTQGILF